MEERGISVSRACKIVSLPRSQFYYTSKKDDTAIISELEDLAYKHSFLWIQEAIGLSETGGPSLQSQEGLPGL